MVTTPHEIMKKWKLDPHHEAREIFSDSMGLTLFDGQTLRLEFIAARMDEPKLPEPTGTRHIVSRMVLSTNCAVELINQMQQVAAQLAQAGLIKVEQPASPPVKPN